MENLLPETICLENFVFEWQWKRKYHAEKLCKLYFFEIVVYLKMKWDWKIPKLELRSFDFIFSLFRSYLFVVENKLSFKIQNC